MGGVGVVMRQRINHHHQTNKAKKREATYEAAHSSRANGHLTPSLATCMHGPHQSDATSRGGTASGSDPFPHGSPDWRQCPRASATGCAPACAQTSAPSSWPVRRSPLSSGSILCGHFELYIFANTMGYGVGGKVRTLPEHGSLLEHRLLPQIRLVGADLIACDHRDLVARRLALYARRHSDLRGGQTNIADTD